MGVMTMEMAKAMFRYDREAGKLYWKQRPLSHFATETAWKIWNAWAPGREVGSISSGYRTFNTGGQNFSTHRVIYFLETGQWPVEVDHDNGDGLDNRFSNLFDVSHAENMKNLPLRKSNTSGYPGVMWEKSKCLWVARIPVNGKLKTLGRSKDKNKVIAIRQRAEAELGYHVNHGRAA